MSTNLMAFSPAPQGKPHPPPWRAAQGGYGYDIKSEIALDPSAELPVGLDESDTIWLIAALLRLSGHFYLCVPVISNISFSEAATSASDPILRPFEIEQRLFRWGGDKDDQVSIAELEWVQKKLQPTAILMKRDSAFAAAMRALDQANIQGRTSASLPATWGALEQLFLPSPSELRFRIAAYIASYLAAPGPERLALYKHVLELYNQRSKAAHTATRIDSAPLAQSFIILRNALLQMIDNEAVPTQSELETMLLSPLGSSGVGKTPLDH